MESEELTIVLRNKLKSLGERVNRCRENSTKQRGSFWVESEEADKAKEGRGERERTTY